MITFATAKPTSDENRECCLRKTIKIKKWNL